jgi:metal-responsive CopG/Arc/MetJ family transcriptional regulator
MPGRSTRILNVSVSQEMYDDIEAIAREESRTKSELMREAFRQYRFNRQWRFIRRWGEESALRTDVQSDEDVEKLAG